MAEGKARGFGERVIGDSNRTVFIGDYSDASNGEIEDLFPADYFGKVVSAAHGGRQLKPTKNEGSLRGNVARYTAILERVGRGPFVKWRTAAALRDEILAHPDSVPSETLDRASTIFQRLNQVLNISS